MQLSIFYWFIRIKINFQKLSSFLLDTYLEINLWYFLFPNFYKPISKNTKYDISYLVFLESQFLRKQTWYIFQIIYLQNILLLHSNTYLSC